MMMQTFHSSLSSLGEENAIERPYRMTATLTAPQKVVLQELASKYRVSVAWLIRQAIDRFLEEVSGGKLPFEMR